MNQLQGASFAHRGAMYAAYIRLREAVSEPRLVTDYSLFVFQVVKLYSGASIPTYTLWYVPLHNTNSYIYLAVIDFTKSEHGNTRFRVVCVASDGESRRGTAFAMEYMKQELSRDSPIHAHVGSLELKNMLVGDDDVTPDTDFKHAFKCLRSLAMRDAGIDILGVHISVATLREHLLANGLTPKQVNAYLNPNDKQDVPLLYRLLRAIWSLPPAPDSSPPLFVQARNALRVFGKLAHNLVMPYISLDMNLRLGPRHRS
jgi:hypothetical protein